MMRVYKRGSEPKGCTYVGRGSQWGNPFRIGYDGTRAEVIQKFRLYAAQRLVKERNWLTPLVGKDLVCHCSPLPCHGDVIIELIRDLHIELPCDGAPGQFNKGDEND